jgi:hypothetical protein
MSTTAATAASDGETNSNGLTYSNGLLSPEEAAARLRCSAYTLARWRLEGRGPKWRRIGPKRVAYAIGDINAFNGESLDSFEVDVLGIKALSVRN